MPVVFASGPRQDIAHQVIFDELRVTDGAEGAGFIKEIQSLLEAPAALAL